MTKRKPRTTFTVAETEDTITRGSVLYDNQFRNRLVYDRITVLTQAINAWRSNPIARRIIEITTEFTVGNGIGFNSPQSKTRNFIDLFWNDPLNNLDQQIPEWADEAWRTGDLFLLVSVDAAGMSYVRAIPSEQITEIVTTDNDYRQEIAYKKSAIDDNPWRAYDPDVEQNTFVLHFPLNRAIGASFGESDLAPVLYWISLYKQFLEDRARNNHYRQVFSYVITRPFTSQAEKDSYIAQFNARMPQKSGGILALSPDELIGTLNPQLASYEAGEDGLAIKRMIATGAGIPLHYLAEPESSTRTTADAAGTPTFKRFQHRQEFITFALSTLLKTVLTIRRQVDGRIPSKPEIVLQPPDVTERDNANLALSVQRVVSAFAPLYNAKLIDAAELLRITYRFTAEVPPELPKNLKFIPVNMRGGTTGGGSSKEKDPTAPADDTERADQ